MATDPDWRDLVIASVADKPIGIMQIINPAEEETHYSGDVAARKPISAADLGLR